MTSPRLLLLSLMVAAGPSLLAGCGGNSPMSMSGSGGSSGGDAAGSGGRTGAVDAGPVDRGPPMNPVPGPCTPAIEMHPDEGAQHLVQCSQTTYLTNPPSSGNHYPTWPAYRIYDQPVPWGFLVHGLEHGGVVVSYRCDSGCAADVDKLRAFVATVPPDTALCAGAPKRIIVVPDPYLDVPFAASAWTWTLKASCFDLDALGKFITDHYGMTAEAAVCSPGPDLSTTGWCPAAH